MLIEKKNEGFDNTSKNFIECFNDCYLTQIVNEPTRENSIMDLVLVM